MKGFNKIGQYFEAFCGKDIDTIRAMFAREVTLQDPFVGRVEGLENVMQVYQEMFAGNEFELEIRRQYQQDGQSYAVEFSLIITNRDGERTFIEGVDCIELRKEKIIAIRAYLDVQDISIDSTN